MNLFDWAIVNEGLRLTLSLVYFTAGMICIGYAVLAITDDDKLK